MMKSALGDGDQQLQRLRRTIMPRCTAMLRVAFALIALPLCSWAQANAPQGNVTGTVAYRERIALPPDAAIDVRLEDTSLQDAQAKLIGESVFAAAGQQVPIPFQVSFNTADINPAHTYQLRANITVNAVKLFVSTSAYPVITNGAPMQANIMLQKVQAPPTEKSSGQKLHGTYWSLVELKGKPAVPGMGRTQPFIRLHREQSRFEGSSGCNGVVGTYLVEQNALQFNPSATTLMMCPQALMEQEQGLIAALKATSSYKIEGDMLELINGTAVVARFQAMAKD
jgi:putative lipoprotein